MQVIYHSTAFETLYQKLIFEQFLEFFKILVKIKNNHWKYVKFISTTKVVSTCGDDCNRGCCENLARLHKPFTSNTRKTDFHFIFDNHGRLRVN